MLSLVAEQAHDVRLNPNLKLHEGIGNALRTPCTIVFHGNHNSRWSY